MFATGAGPEADIEIPETMIQERIQFELNPTFLPPESASPEFLTKWQRMVPAEKRKRFMLRQLDKYESITLVSAVSRHSHFRVRVGVSVRNIRLRKPSPGRDWNPQCTKALIMLDSRLSNRPFGLSMDLTLQLE